MGRQMGSGFYLDELVLMYCLKSTAIATSLPCLWLPWQPAAANNEKLTGFFGYLKNPTEYR